jgi:PAS domain S-box-containing protein
MPFSSYKKPQNKNSSSPVSIISEWSAQALLTMGDAVITTNASGGITAMNKLAEELTGWSLSESSGKHIESIFDAINEHTKLPIENPINKALYENKTTLLSNHTILINKDKTQRYIADSALPIHNERSDIIGGALIFRDVTELSESKKKLVESEELLRGIMDNTALVIYIKDLEGKYVFVNRQKELIFNIKAEDLIGKKSLDHLTENQAAISKVAEEHAIAHNRLIEFEQEIQHPDGVIHSYHTTKFPLHNTNKEIVAVCSVSTDVTEHKRNAEMKEKIAFQEIILKSEIQYDELTKNMPNMFFSLDPQFRYTSFNHACEKLTGKKLEEVLGKTMREAFPDGAYLFLPEYKEVLETGKAKNFISYFNIGDDILTYMVNIYPTEKGVSVLMTDLTLQTKAETETHELLESLQKKNKELRQYAYTVSHDLRAPIARVLGLVSLTKIDPEYKINNLSILENVANEITKLDSVVRDMSTSISVRDEAAKNEYVSFEKELQLLKMILEKEIIESKAVISSEFNEAEGITTIKSYVYSIMYNLLSNAIKYRSHNVPLSIQFKTRQDKQFTCLTVSDNGMGIDMIKNGDKIFGLYNRFHGKKIEGKGIGLSLVKAQVESVGGRVEVFSEVDRGSIFSVYFPLNTK